MVTSADVEQKIREVVAEQLGIAEDEIQPSSKFGGDLGADSLDFFEVIMAMEEEFELEIPDADSEKFDAVQDLIDYVTSRTHS